MATKIWAHGYGAVTEITRPVVSPVTGREKYYTLKTRPTYHYEEVPYGTETVYRSSVTGRDYETLEAAKRAGHRALVQKAKKEDARRRAEEEARKRRAAKRPTVLDRTLTPGDMRTIYGREWGSGDPGFNAMQTSAFIKASIEELIADRVAPDELLGHGYITESEYDSIADYYEA